MNKQFIPDLRAMADFQEKVLNSGIAGVLREAADYIIALEADNKKLREGLAWELVYGPDRSSPSRYCYVFGCRIDSPHDHDKEKL
jgi:hypothetical protein